MSRRRRPASPAAASATAMTLSQTSGAALTGLPGSFCIRAFRGFLGAQPQHGRDRVAGHDQPLKLMIAAR